MALFSVIAIILMASLLTFWLASEGGLKDKLGKLICLLIWISAGSGCWFIYVNLPFISTVN